MSALTQWAYRQLAVGRNVEVAPGFHVGPGSRLWAPQRLTIHPNVYVGKWCTIEVNGSIGRGTLIANNVGVIGRSDHDMRQVGVPIRKARWVGSPGTEDLQAQVEIGDDVWIGYGAIIVGSLRIGRGAVVAAGALVVSDVAPYAIVGGNPSRQIGQRFSDSEKNIHDERLAAENISRTSE